MNRNINNLYMYCPSLNFIAVRCTCFVSGVCINCYKFYGALHLMHKLIDYVFLYYFSPSIIFCSSGVIS
jgi:hypothetical protein